MRVPQTQALSSKAANLRAARSLAMGSAPSLGLPSAVGVDDDKNEPLPTVQLFVYAESTECVTRALDTVRGYAATRFSDITLEEREALKRMSQTEVQYTRMCHHVCCF